MIVYADRLLVAILDWSGRFCEPAYSGNPKPKNPGFRVAWRFHHRMCLQLQSLWCLGLYARAKAVRHNQFLVAFACFPNVLATADRLCLFLSLLPAVWLRFDSCCLCARTVESDALISKSLLSFTPQGAMEECLRASTRREPWRRDPNMFSLDFLDNNRYIYVHLP